jgi:hypothetical protein
MRNLIILVYILIISTWNTFASEYILTSSDKLIVNKLSSKIQKLLDKQTLSFRSTLESKINEIQEEYKNSLKFYTIFEEIKKNTHLVSNKQEYTKHYNDYYIDFKKVKNTWLNWHNQARSNLWLELYSYDERLDSTAYKWSKQQQTDKIMSHKRNPWDWFYNYPVIEKWFNDRWVKCKILWWTTSSESVWKFWYYCNDYDCTDELIETLKWIFDIYMAEKGLGSPADAHYRWIINSNLSKIWLGINIEESFEDTYKDYRSYNYYVTTHYCTEFKK